MTAMTDERRVSDLTLSEAMKLWREHGGDSFGPRVEHVSMKQAGFLDFCNALLARRSQEPDGWRPIETAPKDGTCIYLAWNSEDWTMAEGMWRGDEWVTSATFYNPDVPHPRMEFREYRPKNPLWWRPLPAAPIPQSNEAK